MLRKNGSRGLDGLCRRKEWLTVSKCVLAQQVIICIYPMHMRPDCDECEAVRELDVVSELAPNDGSCEE